MPIMKKFVIGYFKLYSMTENKRLKIYKKVLLEYQKKNNKTILRKGLCIVINKFLKEVFISHKIEEMFPELYKQKPFLTYSRLYWYRPGNKLDRINCLKKAITLIE